MTAGSGSMPLDQEARERAVSDLDSSYCMEAGAGTGKTTLLVGRYLSIIRSGKAGCRQIVAITFTEKAAAEMKSRLRRDLQQALSDSGPGSGVHANLSTALDEIEGAPISTIHAFASTLLREYPVEAGIDPGFRLLDEIEGSILLDECWSAFLASASESETEMLRNWNMAGGSTGKLRDIAMRLYRDRGRDVLSGLFDVREDKPSRPKGSGGGEIDPRTLADLFSEAAGMLSSILDSSRVRPDDRGVSAIRSFLEGIEVLMSRTGSIEGDDALVFSLPKGAGSMANWDPPESCREQKAIFRRLADAQKAAREALVTSMRDGIDSYIDGFIRSVEKRKKDEGLLDFDDLLINARKLVDDSAVLGSIRRRFRYFLVDEFQDTDPVQAELVMLLAGGGQPAEDGLTDPGRLFIVGDPKQSIYRFRRADIEIYEKVKRRFRDNGQLLRISQNFRSLPGVTEWVNGLFSRLIVCPEGRYYQPDYEPVHAWRAGGDAAVISLGLDPVEKGADAFRRAEGDAVARFITALVKSGREVMDPVTRLARPVRLGDIAVLYRGTTGIEHYEDAMRDNDLPYIVEGGRLYHTRQEIRDISTAMWAIEDPRDSLALVSILRSGILGLSDERLLLFRAGGGRFDYLDPSIPPGGGFDDIAGAFDLLARLHRQRNEKGSAETLKDLLRSTGYTGLSLLQPHGRQRVENLRKAVETARAFDSAHHSFRQFARWMRDQEKLGVAEGESPVIDGDENAVRLLTIHKSKGLQFPVVIIVNLVQRVSHAGRLLIAPSGMPSFDLGEGWRTDDFDWNSQEERLKDAAETARLLYVASTRAGDLLVIPRDPEAKGHYGIISAGFEEIVETVAEGSAIPSGGRAGEVLGMQAGDLENKADGESGSSRKGKWPRSRSRETADDITRWKKEKETALSRGMRTPLFITPSTLAVHGGGAAGPGPESGHSGARPDAEDADAPAAAEIGTAFHRVMETVPFDMGMDCGAITREELSKAGLEAMEGEIAPLVENTLRSGLVSRASAAQRVFREVSFSVPLEGILEDSPESGIGGILEGRVDLLFEDEDGWTLVDYKTDTVRPGDEAGRARSYTAQAAAYALALGALGAYPAGGVYLLFARTGRAVRIEVTERETSLVRDRILAAAGRD